MLERVASRALARPLQLIPTERGADVVLLRPPNDVVFQGLREVDGVPHVALSQLTIDCLSGNGRMPAEGEALIEYMTDDESRWRRASLPNTVPPLLAWRADAGPAARDRSTGPPAASSWPTTSLRPRCSVPAIAFPRG